MNLDRLPRHEVGHALYAWGQGDGFRIDEVMVGAESGCAYVTFPLAAWQLRNALRPGGSPRVLSNLQGILGTIMAGCFAEPTLLCGHDYERVTSWRAEWATLRNPPMAWPSLQATVRADLMRWFETYGAEVSDLARTLATVGHMSGDRFRREAQALGLRQGYWQQHKTDSLPLPRLPDMDWRASWLAAGYVTYA
jgi:hypothetical protein